MQVRRRRNQALSATFVTQFICAALQALTCVALPRIFPPAEVSRYFVILTLINLGVTVASLGVAPTLEKNFGGCLARGHARALLRWAMRTRLPQLLATVAGIAVLSLTFELLPSLTLAITAVIVLRCLGDTPYQLLVSVHQPLRALAGHTLRLSLRLPLVILGYGHAQWIGVVLWLGLGEVLVGAWGIAMSRSLLQKASGEATAQTPATREWNRFAVGSGLATLILVPLLQGSVLLVAALASHAEQVAFFGIAWQISVLVLQVSFVFCRTQLPLLKENTHRPRAFRSLVRSQAWVTLFAFFALTTVAAATGGPVFSIALGTKYEEVIPWLVPSLVTSGLLATAYVFHNALYALGHSAQVARLLGAHALLTLGSAVLIAHFHSVLAVPWAMALCTAFLLAATLWKSACWLGRDRPSQDYPWTAGSLMGKLDYS